MENITFLKTTTFVKSLSLRDPRNFRNPFISYDGLKAASKMLMHIT